MAKMSHGSGRTILISEAIDPKPPRIVGGGGDDGATGERSREEVRVLDVEGRSTRVTRRVRRGIPAVGPRELRIVEVGRLHTALVDRESRSLDLHGRNAHLGPGARRAHRPT